MQTILNDILDAHGGLAYWRSLERIEIIYSANGFLFTAKGVAPLKQARMTIYTSRPEVIAHDHPAHGQSTHWFGDERVEIVDARGCVLQSRKHPRTAFGGLRRFFRWDALNFAYFSSYAMWGYLTSPFLFLQDGVKVSSETDGDGTHLAVEFPPSIPAHCRRQDFWFDAEHHLLRLDYTAEVVGSWAKAAHFCEEYRRFDGLLLPTRRRVYPKLLFSKPFRLLTLVAIDIHDVIPHAAPAESFEP